MAPSARLRKRARKLAVKLAAYGREPEDKQVFECPTCGYEGLFKPRFGHNAVRLDALCPECGSMERHRHLSLWLSENADMTLGDVLHFAPERQLKKILAPRSSSYTTADIREGAADRVLNIEALEIDDASFDTVVCNHVLEHVDDTKALSELLRILRPGGRAIVMVPFIASWSDSYEDPTITSEQDRHRHFGQTDHVRYFGWDVHDRIKKAGFKLSTIPVTGLQAARYGLIREDLIFVCIKD